MILDNIKGLLEVKLSISRPSTRSVVGVFSQFLYVLPQVEVVGRILEFLRFAPGQGLSNGLMDISMFKFFSGSRVD